MGASAKIVHSRELQETPPTVRDAPVPSLDDDPVWAIMMDHLHTHMQDRPRLYELLAR